MAISNQAFAHGYQTYPMSRTEYQRLYNMASVVWALQSVASNLTGAGGSSYEAILGFSGELLGVFQKI